LERRTRTLASGKTADRYTVTLDSKPLSLDFDTKTLGAPVAQAITDHLRQRLSEIGATASPATLKARKAEQVAFEKGKPWAVKRFSGGKIGPTPPNQSTRIGFDSGRLANGLVANPTKDNNWVINVPANRLNAASLGSDAAVMRVLDRLRQFVPEFGSASALTTVLSVRRAIKEASAAITQKSRGKAISKYVGEAFKVVLQELAK
jgi:hypothetical protein